MYKALRSFAGVVTMYAGETKDIKDKEIAKDLIEAGYIEEYPAKKKEAPKKTTKK